MRISLLDAPAWCRSRSFLKYSDSTGSECMSMFNSVSLYSAWDQTKAVTRLPRKRTPCWMVNQPSLA